MDVKVEIKKKELEKGVNSSTLTKLKWKRTHISTDDKLVTEKKATGKTFKTSKGDAFSDYYVELRVPYRRYLLTSDFVHELKQYDFKMEVAAVEFAVAVVAGVTAFFCPDAAQLSVKAAIAGTEDTIEAVKDFKPYRKNMEKANKHNYKLIHYYYKVTIEGHTAIISQSLIDYYKGSIFYDRETGTFTKGPKGRPTL
jgi:hypothetical protein